jgi:hypothetical protein
MATTTETYVRNQLYQVPLTELQSDPAQPRKYLDPTALDELTASVTQHGILQPILFRRDEQTKLLYVVAGERRSAAARKAGLTEVPAVFIDSRNYAEIALVENLLRQDLTPIEEAETWPASSGRRPPPSRKPSPSRNSPRRSVTNAAWTPRYRKKSSSVWPRTNSSAA